VPVRAYPFGPPDRLELDPGYAEVRAGAALCPVRLPYGEPAWLVVGYDDVRAVHGDPRFSRAAKAVHDEPRVFPDKVDGGIMDLDPPEHTRLRRLVAKAFTVSRVDRLRPRAEAVAAGLLDTMAAAGPPADLVAGFAVPLPATLICALLGVPYADQERFRDWAGAFISTTSLSPEARAERLAELAGYIAALLAARRAEPADDLLSGLVAAQDGDDQLSEAELVQLAIMLLAAGYETTATEITNFTYLLLTQREHWELLRGRPELVPTAVEELLRYSPLTAATILARWATEDVPLRVGTVPAGAPVLASSEAGDRDPTVFTDPDRLDLTRTPNPHLAFGHGPHHCLGANLARMELQVALGALVRRFPGLELAVRSDELEWKTGLVVRGPVALPVRW
jgi:cytochrome P450